VVWKIAIGSVVPQKLGNIPFEERVRPGAAAAVAAETITFQFSHGEIN